MTNQLFHSLNRILPPALWRWCGAAALAASVLLLPQTVLGQADIAISNVAVDSGPFKPGDTATIAVTVTNSGDVAAGPGESIIVTATIPGLGGGSYASTPPFNGVIDPDGGTTVLTINVPITQSVTNGDYDVTQVVLTSSTLGSDLRADAGIITVRAFADLVVTNTRLIGQPYYPGSTATLEVTVTNSGDRDALVASVIAASVNPPPSAAGSNGFDLTASGTVPALVIGDAVVITLTGVVPLDNPNGTYEVIVNLDSTAQVPEGEGEGNNTSALAFDINTLPDLVVRDLVYDIGAWVAGDFINIQLDYENRRFAGPGRTLRVDNIPGQGYYIEVVLSTDTVFGNNDDFLLHRRKIFGHPYAANRDFDPRAAVGEVITDITTGNLLPGDVVNYSWLQMIPANLVGDYYVLAKIDVDEAITEFVEDDRSRNGNNVWTTLETAKITILPSSAPDATTERVSVRSDGSEGDLLSDEPSITTDGRYVAFSSLARLDPEDTNDFYDVYLKDNYTGELTLVSREFPTLGRRGDSRLPMISGNGEFVVFQSDSARLDPADSNQQTDIYLWQRRTRILSRVSIPDNALVQPDNPARLANNASFSPSVSVDGNRIAFASRATNLVADAVPAGISQVYVRDVTAGTTTLVSRGATVGSGNSTEPVISKDGAFVAFTSAAVNLGASAASSQIFRVGTDGSGLQLISRATGAAGAVGIGRSFNPAISADGNVVAFASEAANLVGGDINGVSDIFYRVVSAATTTRILAADGSEPNPLTEESTGTRGAVQPSISDDGNIITFRSQSDNLLPRTVVRSDGQSVTLPAYGPDGYIPVADQLTGLFPGAENASTDAILGYSDLNSQHTYRSTPTSDIYLHDRTAPAGENIELISRNNFGYVAPALVLGNEASTPSSRNARISGDGRYVVFSNDGRGLTGLAHGRTNRISPDGNEVRDVFIRDRKTLKQFQFDNPPTVSISQPVEGAALTVGQPVVITADAQDTAPGFVVSVDFYINGIFAGSRNRDGFFLLWTPEQPGAYRIDVIATDNDGLRAASAPVNVTVAVAAAPSVSIISPVNNATLYSTQPFTIHAFANDSSGIVTQVEFFISGQSVGVDTAAPFSTGVAPINPGSYYLHAVATNNSGYSAASLPVQITVVNGGALTVTLTEPLTDLTLNAPVQLAATATGSSVFVQEVQFYANGIPVGSGTYGLVNNVGTWTTNYTPVWPGQAAIFAIATDSTGNSYMSNVATFAVEAGNPPVLAVVAPTPPTGDLLELGSTVTLSADVTSGSPGTAIEAVEVFINGSGPVVLALASAPQYTATWQPAQLGPVEAVFVARDSIGNVVSSTRNYNVQAGTPPLVSVIAPDPLAGPLPVAVPVTLVAEAEDPDGNVVSAEFFIDGVSLGLGVLNLVSGDYAISWTPSSLGSFEITAEVVDNRGNRTVSAPIILDVTTGQGPDVSNPLPANGSSLNRGQLVTLSVQASDPDGTIAEVFVSINGGAPLAMTETVSIGTYTVDWTPVLLGNTPVVFTAIDNLGNPTSLAVAYNVITGAAPVISSISPASGSSLPRGIPAVLDLTATDADGTITSVTASINGGAPQVMTTGGAINSYTLTWTPQLAGLNNIVFTATDNLGNTSTSAVNYVVVSGVAPTVSIINPVDGASYWTSQPFTLYALANDTDGNVVSVEFFANGQPVGTVTSAPYVLAIGPNNVAFGPGVYALTAVAQDNNGSRTTSATVTITLIDPAAPAIAITSPAAPGPLTLDAETEFVITVTGADAPVTAVQLLVNGAPVSAATVLNGVWYASYTPRTLDDFEVRARVSNSLGGVYDSAPLIYSTVQGAAPVVVMTGPGANLEIGEEAEISATITDADGSIAVVNVLVNGVVVGQAGPGQALGSYRFAYTPSQTGTYVFAMEAFDNLGNRSFGQTSSLVTAGLPPLVSIVAPDPTDVLPLPSGDGVADAALFINQPINFSAAISDDGLITNVSFTLNGAPLDPVTFSAGVYSAAFTPAAVGVYTLVVSATDNRGNTTSDSLSYTVEAGAAPGVTILLPNPLDGDSDGVADQPLAIFTPVVLTALASDTDGNVVSVEYRIDGASIGLGVLNGVTGRHELTWIPTGLGYFVVQAIATDNLGNTTSGAVSYRVVTGQAPSLQNLDPASGDTLRVGIEYIISVDADDPDGSIASVTASINGGPQQAMLETVALGNYTLAWRPALLGANLVRITATDNTGNPTTLDVTYNVISGDAPTVQILSPDPADADTDGFADNLLTVGAEYTIAAIAGDTDGTVEAVTVRINNGLPIPMAQAFTPGVFETTWTPTTVGNYRVDVSAVDDAGNVSTDSINYTVAAGAVPVLSNILPADGSSIRLSFPTTLSVAAADPDGLVTSVTVSINDGPAQPMIESGSVGTYTFDWTPNLLGNNLVRYSATDNLGNVTSVTVTYPVVTGSIPVVSILTPSPADADSDGIADGLLVRNTLYPLTVSASDPDGSIASVVVRINNGTPIVMTEAVEVDQFVYNWTPSLLGLHEVVVTATDNLGNALSVTAVYNVISGGVPLLEIVAPDPTDLDGDGVADATLLAGVSYALTATASDLDGAIVAVTASINGGAELTLVESGAIGSYVVNWTPQLTGLYVVVVSAEDNTGNRVQRTVRYRVLFTGPSISAIEPANGSSLRRNEQLELVLFASAGDAPIVSVTAVVNATQTIALEQLGAIGRYVSPWTPSLNGLNSVVFTVTDAVGQTAVATANYTVSDAVGPAILSVSPSGGSTLQRNAPQTLVANISTGDALITSVTATINGNAVIDLVETGLLGTYLAPWTPLLGGNNVVVFRAVDELGNVAIRTASYTVIAEAGPTITAINPSSGSSLQRNLPVVLNLSALAGDSPIASVTASINGRQEFEMVETYAVGTFTYEWTPALVGNNVVIYTVTDELGNTAVQTATYSVIDTAGPSIISINPPSGAQFKRGVGGSISVTAMAGAAPIETVTASINGRVELEMTEVLTVGTFSVNWVPQLNGINAVVFTVTDTLGNAAVQTVNYTVTEAAGPTIISLDPPSGASFVRQAVTVLSVTAAPGDTPIVQVTASIPGAPPLTLEQTDEFGVYSIGWESSFVGNYPVTYTVTDSLGKTAVAVANYTVRKPQGPAITGATPASGTTLLRDVPVVVGVSARAGDNPLASVTLRINGGAPQAVNEIGFVGNFGLEWTPTLLGDNVLTYTATDVLGKVAVSTVIYRVVAPGGPVITSVRPGSGTPLPRNVPVSLGAVVTPGFAPLVSVSARINYFTEVPLTQTSEAGYYETSWLTNLVGNNIVEFIATDALGNSVSVTANYTVHSGMGPSVSIISPYHNSRYLPGTVLPVHVQAYDSDGLVEQVEFYLNGQLMRAIAGSPYIGEIRLEGSGAYVLGAVAIDNTGNRSAAMPVTVFAGPQEEGAPIVLLDHPLPWDMPNRAHDISLGSDFYLNATAYDPDGDIREVVFRVNDQLIGPATQRLGDRYSRYFRPSAQGVYYLFAEAVDNDGKRTSSLPIVLTVGPLDSPLPRVELLQPEADANLQRVVRMIAGVDTRPGVLTRMEFYANGVWLGASDAPLADGIHSFSWVPDAPGDYQLSVRAIQTDPAAFVGPDNWVVSAPVPVKVLETGSAMEVTFLTPINGTRYLPGTQLPVEVMASTPDGLVTGVEFYLNGELVQVLGEAPYRAVISLPAPGNYILGAVALDSLGNRVSAAPLLVTAGPPDTRIPAVVMEHPLPMGGGDNVNDVSVTSAMFLNASVVAGEADIVDVRFYINGQLLGPAESNLGNLYARYFKPNAPGIYYLTAEATDSAGFVGQSLPIALSVGPMESPMPKGELYQPFRQSLLGRIVGIFVEVDAGLQTVDRVDFYANGILIGSTETPVAEDLFAFNWVPQQAGQFDLRARIVQIDPGGNTWDNWTITGGSPVEIVDPGPGLEPSIAIVSPQDGARHTVLNPIALQANALDPLGSVTEVRFYANGRLLTPSVTQFPYTVSFLPTSPGQYQLVAEMISDRGLRVQSEPVTALVGAAALPTVTIQAPLNGAAITVGRPILISATATSGTSTPMEVDFFVNGVFIGRSSEIPYRITWTPQSTGQFALRAEAREVGTAGVAGSNEISVRVNPTAFPTARFIAPGAVNPTAGSDVLLEVSAEDSDGFVSFVEFYVNGELIDTDNSEPFATFWRPLSAGRYDLMALVVDNSGNATIVDRAVTVGNPVGIVPRVTLSVTASGNVTPGSRVVVRANIFDDTPEQVSVTFFMNGVQLAPAMTAPPYTIVVDPQIRSANFYEITAVAADPDGNSRADTLRPLYISDVTVEQPSLQIISLKEGDELTVGSRAPIRVEVSGGAVPSIAAVVFYADGVEVGRSTQAPYAFDWVPQRVGQVQVTAATLLRTEGYDHDGDPNTPAIAVTPVNVAPPVNVQVNPASGTLPSISLSVLPRNDNLAVGSRILLYADAQDLDGSVESVSFFINGDLVSVVSAPPFVHSLTTTAEGNFSVNALATDNDGNVVTSSFVSYETKARVVTQTPSVQLTVPASGQQGSILSLRASTQGFINGPEGVVFYVNGLVVGQSTQLPYNLPWLSNLDGNLVFFATAQQPLGDGSFVTAVSPVVTAVLAPNAPPVIGSILVEYPGSDPLIKPSPLIGEAITFTVEVADSGPVDRVELLRDGTSIAVSASQTIPYIMVDTPPGIGAYQYSVVATDRGGLQTQSAAVPVTVVRGRSPQVALTSPVVGSSFILNPTIDSQIRLGATATDLDGYVTELVFLVNGQVVSGVFAGPPYVFDYLPAIGGSFTAAARATDNSGNVTTSAPVSFTVVEVPGTFPRILSFTTSSESRRAFVGEPVHFTVQASDSDIIDAVVLKEADRVVDVDTAAPYQLVFVPQLPGIHRLSAEVSNRTGNTTNSEPIEIIVTQPQPLAFNEDFVFQSFLDLFLRAPTAAEVDTFSARLNTGELSRDRFLQELLDPDNGVHSVYYGPVRQAILAHQLLLGEWLNRAALEQAVAIIRASGLTAYISQLMPAIESVYVRDVGSVILVPPIVTIRGVPNTLSPEAERAAYLSYLFVLKYGVVPSAAQLNLAQLQFLASGRDAFTANFIADVRVIATGSSYFTGGLGFQFPALTPPSDRYLREANAASLLLNLLRVQPDDTEVAALADKLFTTQVSEVLADPRYAGRFVTPFTGLEHHASGWKFSPWFGWFNTADPEWIFHAELGWVQFPLSGQSSSSFWFYDAALGWTWTTAASFPYLYTATDNRWLYALRSPYPGANLRWFFDYAANDWTRR